MGCWDNKLITLSKHLVISKAVTSTGFIVNIITTIFYILGPTLLGIAIWKASIIPKWIRLLFALHGLCLSISFGTYPILILGWTLLSVSSMAFIIIMWYLLKSS